MGGNLASLGEGWDPLDKGKLGRISFVVVRGFVKAILCIGY